MTLLGSLLKNRRGLDAHSAWNRPNLQGPETLVVTSPHFDDGRPMPRVHAGPRVGENLSPQLAWSPPPAETSQLLLVVEDLDVPLRTPAVHCLVLIDPGLLETPNELPAGGLARKKPATGVRILRSTISRGYQGPAPIKGHGPHRYTFQLFAFATPIGDHTLLSTLDKARPRALTSAVTAPVLARGQLVGTFER